MKEYSVYGNIEGGVPLILINTYEGDGSSEWEALRKMGLPPFTLVVVHGMDWDADMGPFPADPVFKGQKFLGHAHFYRHLDEDLGLLVLVAGGVEDEGEEIEPVLEVLP